MGAPTIEIGKHPVTLIAPRSIAAYAVQARPSVVRMLALFGEHPPTEDEEIHPELMAAMQDADCTATRCAALALCWPPTAAWPVKRRPRPWKLRQPIEEYGAEVFDGLVAGGISPGAVIAASWPALWWLLSTITTSADVTAAEDFSGAPLGA